MPRSFVELSLEERRRVAQLPGHKVRVSKIAEVLGRHRSTIYREIRRNWWHDREVPAADGYWPVTAQKLAADRRARQRKLARNPELRAAVIERLRQGWSPEQIAGRLRVEPGVRHRLCHETIYAWIYSPAGQSEDLARHLPERRRQRRPRRARRPRGLVFPDAARIKFRPEAANNRSEFGHWECDLMIFRKEHGVANVATITERKTRYTVLFRNADRRSKAIMANLIDLFSPLPAFARRSLTFDRGLEFVSWRLLETALAARVWFCDPQAPWQKGAVENMNRRIRRYLPAETVLFSLPDRHMVSLCEHLNATPRKCLGYRTPTEAFRDQIMEAGRAGV